MTLKYLVIGLLTILLSSCNQGGKYTPDNLRKLSEKELLENAEKRKTFSFDDVVYKNENGIEISLDSVKKIPNIQEWTADSYVNENNEIKELILRRATEKDKEFQEKLTVIYEKVTYIEEIVDTVIPIEIDCNNIQEILTKVYTLDQDMRTNGKGIDPNIDRENLITVVSLIEKCGMPTLKEVNQEQMSAIWFVFQHADNYHRKKYLPQLKASVTNGDLRKSQMALMEDRILKMDGKAQIYGSQMTDDRETGGWKIYDLENPETVDKRRAEVGLQPLSEYVKQWDIEFNTKQNE